MFAPTEVHVWKRIVVADIRDADAGFGCDHLPQLDKNGSIHNNLSLSVILRGYNDYNIKSARVGKGKQKFQLLFFSSVVDQRTVEKSIVKDNMHAT